MNASVFHFEEVRRSKSRRPTVASQCEKRRQTEPTGSHEPKEESQHRHSTTTRGTHNNTRVRQEPRSRPTRGKNQVINSPAELRQQVLRRLSRRLRRSELTTPSHVFPKTKFGQPRPDELGGFRRPPTQRLASKKGQDKQHEPRAGKRPGVNAT